MKIYGLWMISFLLITGGCKKSEQKLEIANSQPKYTIHPKMQTAATNASYLLVPDFSIDSNSDKVTTLYQLLSQRPVVLISIKDGCPCSLKAQPIFNNLAKHYKEKVYFIGLINGSKRCVYEFINDTKPSFSIIADPELKILKPLKFDRASYIAIVNSDRKIEKMWPGYSANILTEINKRLAQLTHTPLRAFDPQYAPKVPTSGCKLK